MENEREEKRPVFERSVESDLLIDYLDMLEVGQTTTYEEIQEACGADIRTTRHVKDTACKVLLNEKAKSFATVRAVGIKRIGQSDVVAQSKAGTDRVYRTAKRERRKLVKGVEDFEKLDTDDRKEYIARRATLEILAYASKRGVKKVQEIAYASDRPLPVQKTIEALKRNDGK